MTHNKVREHLAVLYPDLATNELETLAQRVIDEFGVTLSPPPEGQSPVAQLRSDEVMLITYADTFTTSGQPHLQSLASFWQAELADAFSTIHVLPFFPSSSDGGFSVVDYRAVADGLGDWSDIAELGGPNPPEMMFDVVCNHGSAQSTWFANFIADREPGRGFFRTANPQDDLSLVVRPRTHPLLRAVDTAQGVAHVWATFSHDQIDYDFANPEVVVEFCSILGFYLSQGATRIRLDAIAYLWKELGTSCIHLPETHEVVKLMRTLVAAHDPSVLLVSETNVPHQDNISYFGDGSDEAQVVYNFTLAPLIVWSLIVGDAAVINRWLSQLVPPPRGCAFLNFLASHDGIGLRPVEDLITFDELAPLIDRAREIGGGHSDYSTMYGARPYELNVSLADLLAGPGGQSTDRYLVAHALMLALQGIPAIYVHSLLASPGDTAAVTRTGHRRDINRAQVDLNDARASVTGGWRGDVFVRLVDLIRIRRSQECFGPASPQVVHELHPGVVAVARGDSELLAVHNMTSGEVDVSVPAGFGTFDLIGRAVLERSITLAPWQPVWLVHHRLGDA